MAFNLGGFIGGFSSKLTERIEDEEDRLQKRLEEERQLAMRQRAARSASREKEKAYVEETTGMLSMLGYNDEIIGEIMKKGKGATKFAISTGEKALGKMDVNALWTLPSVSGNMDVDDQKIIDETLTGEERSKTTSVSTGVTTGFVEPEPKKVGGGFGLNQEMFSQLYTPPNEYEATFSARLAKISQQKVRTSNPDKLKALELEENQLLADLKRMKDNEREETGTNTPSFTYGTIASATNAARKSKLNSVGFKTDLEGNIVGELEGREGAYYSAELDTANYLNGTYGELQDPTMAANIKTIRDDARRGLLQYGRTQVSMAADAKQTSYLKPTVDKDEFKANLESGTYKVGDVIQVTTAQGGTRLVIYTGVPDPETGLPFVGE